jgi:ParB-like chromosome segregation protein Spo0J
MGAVLSTNNYDLFSLHEKNRKLNYKKVERLSAAISKKNLLNVYPIVVNKKNVILDGQHRYAAAKAAKATVFYLVSDDGYDMHFISGIHGHS